MAQEWRIPVGEPEGFPERSFSMSKKSVPAIAEPLMPLAQVAVVY